ncbi:MAG: TraY domain-containing protein [Oscillospiraceae bacterium]|nr:MAG: TraY domain-containing protein [Clostridiales bacterium]
METRKRKNYTLRIDAELMDKFRYVCKYDGRSAQSQLQLYIRRMVESFESKHGPIDLTEK